MEQYISKDVLVEEIERKRKYAQTLGNNAINSSMQQFYDGMKQGCVDILSFINTLEMKEVDLEEKATQLSQKYFPDEENIWARPNIEAHKCKSACIEMVEWLKAAQKGE